MKKLLVISLSVIMLVSFAAASWASPAPDKVVKMGVFQALTGENGAGGKQQMLGMEYARTLTPTVEIGGETWRQDVYP
jgi:branched-chain amino acid transport system substrate-binding protein